MSASDTQSKPNPWKLLGITLYGVLEGASVPLTILSLVSLVFASFSLTVVVPIVVCAVLVFAFFFGRKQYNNIVEWNECVSKHASFGVQRPNKQVNTLDIITDVLSACLPFLLGVGFVTGIWTFTGLFAPLVLMGSTSLFIMASASCVFGLAAVWVDMSIIQPYTNQLKAIRQDTTLRTPSNSPRSSNAVSSEAFRSSRPRSNSLPNLANLEAVCAASSPWVSPHPRSCCIIL